MLIAEASAVVAAPMDVTIKGESKEKVTIERVSPEPEVPLKDVIPFSRLGQTDWILSEELDYVDSEKQIAMMDVHSPKTFKPSMIEFPKPPFFVQAYPPPPTPILVDKRPDAPPPPGENETWAFIVVDQNNNLLKKIEGNTIPAEPIQWDGMRGDQFLLRTDEIYSSMLIIQETPEASRTIVGEPISLPALRYVNGTKIVFEFSNRRIYEEGAAGLSPMLRVLIDQTMNDLRKHQGLPFSITIYDRNQDLAQRRVQTWKKMLEENLLQPADNFDVKASMPFDRGEITQVVLEINK
jgi:hypothetical protein